MTKTMYAKQLAILEEEELKQLNEKEPSKSTINVMLGKEK